MGAICRDPNNSSNIIYHHKNIGASWIAILLETLVVIAVVIIFLRRYTSFRKQNIVYLIGIFMGWFLAIYALILMPIDISMVINYFLYNTFLSLISNQNYFFKAWYDKCICEKYTENMSNSTLYQCDSLLPINYIDSEILVIIWKVLYWIPFFSTWYESSFIFYIKFFYCLYKLIMKANLPFDYVIC